MNESTKRNVVLLDKLHQELALLSDNMQILLEAFVEHRIKAGDPSAMRINQLALEVIEKANRIQP